MTEIERRRVELRHGPGRIVTGVAMRYGTVAQLPWGEERIEAGAFAPLGDVILNAHHDRATPLARTGAGLVLDDTAERLAFSATLPATRAADDVLELVRTGIMRGASVEVRVTAERFESGVRVIERARLSGIGVVDTPAYPESEVEARRRRGGRRTWVRGGIKYGVKAHCTCLTDGEMRRGLFRPEALRSSREVLDVDYALTGRARDGKRRLQATSGATLCASATRRMRWNSEIDEVHVPRDTAARTPAR